SEIGEYEPSELVRRIGALPDALLEAAAGGLAPGVQTPSVDVVDPAVIAAPQAPLERDSELERRAAMCTMQVQHAHSPAAVAEHHEILAEDPHPQRRLREIARECDRLPEP